MGIHSFIFTLIYIWNLKISTRTAFNEVYILILQSTQ